MRSAALYLPLAMMAAFPASAESLICANPGREYNLSYENGKDDVLVNPDSEQTQWPVMATLFDDRQHIVFVSLGAEGMVALVHIRPYQKVEIFRNGSLFQTDGCHS
jgi:hypothetical protein